MNYYFKIRYFKNETGKYDISYLEYRKKLYFLSK